ncbi:hypothetical protein AB0O31_09130 [Kitasatospora cineracea]|uniref:hypothetical protein n=1 Tax=Kitasatospora cineracea TaxID=88074 RepID=UPI003427750D
MHLIKTIPPRSFFRITPAVLLWEQTPEAERQAILDEHAKNAWPQWLATRTRVEQQRENAADRLRRRVELFATGFDLPSAYDWVNGTEAVA